MKSKFTQKAQNTLGRALECARALEHTYIGSEHLLLGLLGEEDSAASRSIHKRRRYSSYIDRIRSCWSMLSIRTAG